ncbi:hypothetical protein NHH73_09850 [Oxalobacteraceae bacterium OTU3CINTB1]|nr:hypothetical protein NHH73_09850 [Oxalobacteraceae bacterium OTU3CINTB1]
MFKRTVPIICVLVAATASAAPQYVKSDDDATARIRSLIVAGRCQEAVDALKVGVKAKQRDVLLLAGTMYDEGVCLASNWDKAARLYVLADEAGNGSGIPRLITGYAKAGRDNGMALWWLAKSNARTYFPQQCVPRSDPDADPDGFNGELESMPTSLFQGCVYLAGVGTEVFTQAQYPPAALRHGLWGTYVMKFSANDATIAWRQDGVTQDTTQRRGGPDLEDKDYLLTYLKAKGAFALSQYKRPDGPLDPRLLVERSFVFDLR